MLAPAAIGFYYETVISCILGGLAACCVDGLFGDLWLTAFFAIGTDFWWASTNGGPWELCEVLGCLLMLAALLAIQRNHPFLAGLLAGAAALSRYEYALTWPLLLVYYQRLHSTSSTPMNGSAVGEIRHCGYGIEVTPRPWELIDY